DAAHVEIVIEDNGPGPAALEREHLFDPFFSGRPAGRGRGLGLPTAWRLARQHGGDVRFMRPADGPTRFVLTLPRANEPRGQEANLPERLERGEVIYYPVCPFPVASREEVRFLCEQRLASRAHKNISYDPQTGKAAGFRWESAEQAERLRGLLAAFSDQVTS